MSGLLPEHHHQLVLNHLAVKGVIKLMINPWERVGVLPSDGIPVVSAELAHLPTKTTGDAQGYSRTE